MEAASVHPLRAVPDGEIPKDGPQTMGEALQHIHLLEGELERVEDEKDTTYRSWLSAKGETKKWKRRCQEIRKEEEDRDKVQEVLDYWRDKVSPRAEIVEGDDRWEKVRDRLGLSDTKNTTRIVDRDGAGYTVDELKLVVDGALASEWHCGKNDKGKTYLDAGSIFGTSKRVRDHIARAREKWDRDFDERLRVFHESHPSPVFEAIERERQMVELEALEPTAFLPTPAEAKAEAERYEANPRADASESSKDVS